MTKITQFDRVIEQVTIMQAGHASLVAKYNAQITVLNELLEALKSAYQDAKSSPGEELDKIRWQRVELMERKRCYQEFIDQLHKQIE